MRRFNRPVGRGNEDGRWKMEDMPKGCLRQKMGNVERIQRLIRLLGDQDLEV